MKYAFVSTITHYPSGGADVLWTRAAARALAGGAEVLVVIPPAYAPHPAMRALADAGARLLVRPGLSTYRGRLDGLRRSLRRWGGEQDAEAVLRKFAPDRTFFCQGGLADSMLEEGLLKVLGEGGHPFDLICQSNDDNSLFTESERQRVKALFGRARALWFVSQANRSRAEIQLAQPLPNARLVQNPVDLPPAAALPWPGGDTVKLAVVARWEPYPKGLDLLLPALGRALGAEPGWELRFHGRGEGRGYLEQLAEQHGIGARVSFQGYATNIAEIWREHHLLLLPSRLEGCSLAMIEAMLSGRPVLATAVGGAPEWIEDGREGFLCPAPTVALLAETLTRAWKQRERWRELGLAANRRASALRDPAPEERLLAPT